MAGRTLHNCLFPGKHTPGDNRRAFTLVELLVTVSIIALLIAILLPSLSHARGQAKSAVCIAHLKGIFTAATTFQADHHDRMQLIANDGDGVIGVNSVDPDRRLYAYEPNGELLTWPAAFAQGAGINIQRNRDWGVLAADYAAARTALANRPKSDDFELFVCPSDKNIINTPFYPEGTSLRTENNAPETRYWGRLSYAVNEDVLGVEGQPRGITSPWNAVWKNGIEGECTTSDWPRAGLRLRGKIDDRFFDPASCLFMVDAGPEDVSAGEAGAWDNRDPSAFANLVASVQTREGPHLQDFMHVWAHRLPLNRHHIRGALNVSFFDGHAATVKATGWQRSLLDDIEVPAGFSTPVRVSPYQIRAADANRHAPSP